MHAVAIDVDDMSDDDSIVDVVAPPTGLLWSSPTVKFLSTTSSNRSFGGPSRSESDALFALKLHINFWPFSMDKNGMIFQKII
jgi:hypothetical protein